ncbi:hypothetical protein DMN91_002822 [Ooceraea biroi]|uniref:Uncharacterized protein n=1 Tax=Ooceraea biroi TaxID=2015173 RepID=A0A3L8DWQ7_OOCBI|nr:hypothetical protein DMN91_002822 [Ooceraea biroi]
MQPRPYRLFPVCPLVGNDVTKRCGGDNSFFNPPAAENSTRPARYPALDTLQPFVTLHEGGVAQMVERSLSMREVPGSIPGASKIFFS